MDTVRRSVLTAIGFLWGYLTYLSWANFHTLNAWVYIGAMAFTTVTILTIAWWEK